MQQQWSDQELVEGILKGSPAHQIALYRQYNVPMYRILLRYAKDRAEAEDMMQDAFVRVYRDMAQFRGDGALGGWIRRIMINTALSHLRKQKDFLRDTGDFTPFENLFRTDEDTASNIDAESLMKLLQKLPTGYRTVFNLYAIEGFSHEEIAEQLNISIGTSKSQLYKAREFLKKSWTNHILNPRNNQSPLQKLIYMANNQEFNSIDELFRKSFNDLPATPANNGWDTPSDRVWQNINANVQPTSGGWSAGTKWLAAVSISALVLVGAYWAFNRPEPAATLPATPVEQPAVAPTQPAPAPVVTEMPAKAVDNTASAKTKGTDKPGKTPTVTAPTTEANNNGAPKNSAEKTKEAPNSIEKRKLEQVKQQQQ